MSLSLLTRIRPISLQALRQASIYKKTPIQEFGWNWLLKNRYLGRPLSPNLGIYKVELTMGMSGVHRISGCVMAGALLVGGLFFAVVPFNFTQFIDYVRSWNIPVPIKAAFKWVIAFPITYHTINGIRHMGFDLAKGTDIPSVYRSGYIVIAISLLISLYIVARATACNKSVCPKQKAAAAN